MLSIENTPQSDSDPLHLCQLKKIKKLTDLHHLDPSLDNHHHNSNSNSNSNINPKQSPNFSIRGYVFALRNKDLKKNWPFSQENLQLCIKHGVKDPLPPFHIINDSVKNQSYKPCTVEALTVAETKLGDAPAIKEVADQTIKSKPRSVNKLPSTSKNAYQSLLEANQASVDPSAVKIPPLLGRTENRNKQAAKKCRIVVKFGSSVSAEDIASNLTAAASEHMASSKTCPVCKTFSSSSNTTLNAHIDQCLALASKPALVPGSRSFGHKIKPRKVRWMKDIYKTAKECTLEELDSRNGLSWPGLNSNVPGFDTEMSDGEPEEAENQRASSDCSKAKYIGTDQAPVYLDANCTKVCILSKLDDGGTMVTKGSKDVVGMKQPRKGSRGGRIFSSKKKSRHGKKRHKYLKLVPQSTNLVPQKAHTSQASRGPEGYSREDNHKKEERSAAKQVKKLVSSPATSRQWMPLRCNTVIKELNKKGCRRNCDERSLQNSHARRDHVEEVGNIESLRLPKKRSTDHLRNISSSAHPSSISTSAKNDGICGSPSVRKRICSSTGYGKPVKETPTFRSITFNAGKRCFSLKTRPRFLDEGGEDLISRGTSIDHRYNLMQNGFEKHHSEMARKDTTDLSQEESESLQSSQVMAPQYHCLDNEPVPDSSARLRDLCDGETDSLCDSDGNDDDDILEDYDDQEINEERTTTGLTRFLRTEFIQRNHFESPFDSSQSIDEQTGASYDGQVLLHQSEPSFLGGQEVYSFHETACMDMELDSETGRDCFFPVVEPIPIPGPPGSFLPSPRDMVSSDDFPGYSSLTGPARSSEDHRNWLDRKSSDSPVSMASTISNSNIVGRNDHVKYFEQLSSSGIGPGLEKNLDSAASSQQTILEAERHLETERFGFNRLAVEKKPFVYERDDKPCYCQRKERPSQGYISLNFQDSQLLKRRTVASSERQVGVLQNMRPGDSGPLPDITLLDNSHIAVEEPSVSKPSFDGDRASSSPSCSNPVLRLMGKNLMVINEEEDASKHCSRGNLASRRPVPPSVPSFHYMAPRGSLIYDCGTRDASDLRNCYDSSIIKQMPRNSIQGMLQSHDTVPSTRLFSSS